MRAGACPAFSRRPRRGRGALPTVPLGAPTTFFGLESRAVSRDALPHTVFASDERPLRGRDAHDLSARDAHASTRDDDAFDEPVTQLLLVIVAFAVAVVDAAHRGVAPIDDTNPLPRIDVRACPNQDVTAARAGPRRRGSAGSVSVRDTLLEPHVSEVRTRSIDRSADAATALGPERSQVVHLLEERGQVFRLRHRDVIAKLEHPLFVEGAAPRGGEVGARGRL